jgi:DNA-binding transcriptional ArsR family regulator
LGLVETAPGDHDLDSVLSWLRQEDPVRLRERILSGHFCDCDVATVASAARGDASAVERVLADPQLAHKEGDLIDALRAVFLLPAPEMINGLVEVIGRARVEGFGAFEEAWAAALERDAIDKRMTVANAANPRELIETVTNGITFEVPPGATRLVIVPSVSLRPWTLIADFDDSLLVCCPVSEEALSLDPEAPPSWLVATYRALGDEKRLRLLRRLSESPASLAELTEFMGMAKSTVFHHIGVLRAAGLVRVSLDADQTVSTYSLRTESIPDRSALIEQYLQPSRK